MSTITYEKFLGGTRVLLDGKRAGVIQSVEGGFAYLPGGRKKHQGETFATEAEVKRSLES